MSGFDQRWRALAARAASTLPAEPPTHVAPGADLLQQARARRTPVYGVVWWAWPVAAASLAALALVLPASTSSTTPTPTTVSGLLDAWSSPALSGFGGRTRLIPRLSASEPP